MWALGVFLHAYALLFLEIFGEKMKKIVLVVILCLSAPIYAGGILYILDKYVLKTVNEVVLKPAYKGYCKITGQKEDCYIGIEVNTNGNQTELGVNFDHNRKTNLPIYTSKTNKNTPTKLKTTIPDTSKDLGINPTIKDDKNKKINIDSNYHNIITIRYLAKIEGKSFLEKRVEGDKIEHIIKINLHNAKIISDEYILGKTFGFSAIKIKKTTNITKKNGNVIVKITEQAASGAALGFIEPINAETTFIFDKEGNITATGSHDGYPTHEVSIDNKTIHTYTPKSLDMPKLSSDSKKEKWKYNSKKVDNVK